MQLIQRVGSKLVGLATVVAVVAVAVILGGCAAASVSLSKKDLDVQTKTSTAIFVEPVQRAERTVYVEIRSAVAEFDKRSFRGYVKTQFANNEDGYVIVDDPDQAHFQMLIYVLNLEKASPTAAEAALRSGYSGGEAGVGVLAGAAIGSQTGARHGALNGGLIGGIALGVGSLVADNLVHDVTYMLVADISVREKAGKGVMVRKDSSTDTKTSDSGSSQQRVSEVSNKKEYRTRIVTTANKANLKLDEAQDQMFIKTAYAMSSFF